MAAEKYKRLAKDTGLFALSSFGSKLLLFLLTPLYTSILLTEEYGKADILSTTVTLVYPLLTLAISDAVLRFAMDSDADNGVVLRTSLLFVVSSTIVLWFFQPLLSLISIALSEYWIFFVFTYFLFNLHSCFSNFMKGIGKTKLFAIQGIIQTVGIIASNLLFLIVFKFGLKGYLCSIIIGYTLPIIFMFVFGKLYRFLIPLKIDKGTLVRMLKYSVPLIPTLIAWTINASIDRYMIIWFVGESENGIYSVAHKIPTLFTTVATVFVSAWQLSAISNYGSKDDSDFYTMVYNGLHLVSIFAVMAIVALSKPFAALLFAKDFYAGWQYVPMLTLSALFSAYSGFLAAANRAAKKTTILLISVIIGAFINIVLNLFLIPRYGALGASIATFISFFFVWLIRIVSVQWIIRVKINIVKTSVSLLLLIISCVFITFDLSFRFLVWGGSLALLLLIYLFDIIDMAKKIIKVIKEKHFKNTKDIHDSSETNSEGIKS